MQKSVKSGIVGKDNVCDVRSRASNKYQNQTAQLIKLEIYFMLFVHMCVYVHKSDAAGAQAEPSLPSNHKV